MTDKEKMRADFEAVIPKFEDHDGGTAVYFTDEEYEEVAWPVWQAAKESDRKELEAANSERLEVHRLLSAETIAKFAAIKELEAAKRRIADAESALIPKQLPDGLVPHAYGFEATIRNAEYWYGWGHKEADTGKAVMCMAQAMFAWKNAALATAEERMAVETHCELYAAEMSEAKEAGFYSASELYSAYKLMEKKLAAQQAIACKLQNYLKAPNEGNSSLILIAQTLLSIMESSSGELTKREAAAEQRGRDELQKEYSGREPVGYGNEQKATSAVSYGGYTIPLIPRPLPPTDKKG
ncbi:MAG: hypothetical protein WC236_09700 [Gallionellaceae bacterium]|jgi:hypothetical protein